MLQSKTAICFRRNLRRVLTERGITITEAGIYTGIGRPGVSRILAGRENVTLDRADRIAQYLGTTVVELLRDPEQKNFSKRD